MKLPHPNTKNWNWASFGFTVPFVGMLFILIINYCVPFGDNSFLYSDCYHQYFPFFKAFRQTILNGDSLLYNWNIGMGVDFLGLIAYYVASPLNLVSLLLPESWLLGYFSLLLPVRLGLAGLFFALFLKKIFKKNDPSIAVFGSLYALCAWALGYQWNVMWLDTFALLPLVILGMVSLLRDRKFLLYTLTLFLSVFSNYYIGLFTCIFVFFSFFIYEICCGQGFKRFFLDLCLIALYSAIAIAMTAILELPALAALGTTQSSVNKFPDTFSLNIADRTLYAGVNTAWEAAKTAWKAGNTSLFFSHAWTALKGAMAGLWDGMRQCAGNMNASIPNTFKEGLPNLYCGVGSVVLGGLFLTSRKIRLRDKLCSLFMLLFILLSFIIRQLDYIWHGFHFTNMIQYRFSFLFSFILLYMAYRVWLLRKSFKLWQVLVSLALAIGILLCSDQWQQTLDTLTSAQYQSDLAGGVLTDLEAFITPLIFPLINIILLLMYGIILVYTYWPRRFPAREDRDTKKAFLVRRRENHRLAGWLLLGVLTVEILLTLGNFVMNFSVTSVSNYPQGKADTAAIVRLMQEREDSLMYRTESSHTQIYNDGALNGYYGITAFTSSANVNTTKFMQALGYGAKPTYNRYAWEESSPVASLFLNLKYMLERTGNVKSNPYFDTVASSGNVYLLENNAWLPLGFMTDPALGTLDFSKSNGDFEFQNTLLKAATGCTTDVFRTVVGQNLSISGENVDITYQNNAGQCNYTSTAAGVVTYAFTPQEAGLFCIDITQTKIKTGSSYNAFKVYCNGELVYSETYSLPQMLSVCQVVPGDLIEVKFTTKAGDSNKLLTTAAVLNEERFREAYDILNRSTLQVTTFESTRIEGTIVCEEDGLLYTSVPQNAENWVLEVDGEPAQIQLIGDVMIGTQLTAGTHTVTLTYENRAFTLGTLITTLSAGALLVLWILLYKPKFPRLRSVFQKKKA